MDIADTDNATVSSDDKTENAVESYVADTSLYDFG